MYIHRNQIFIAASSPALYQAVATALNELSTQCYSGFGELGRRGVPTENPLLADIKIAQAVVAVVDGSAGDVLVQAEQQYAPARQLPCFAYAAPSLANPPAGSKPFADAADLQKQVKRDLRAWLFGEFLPPLFGKIERGEIPREDALALISAIKDAADVSPEWRNRLAAQGYRLSGKTNEGILRRLIPVGLRAFARMLFFIFVPLLLLLLAYQRSGPSGPESVAISQSSPSPTIDIARAKPSPEFTPLASGLPTPFPSDVAKETETPVITRATPVPSASKSPATAKPVTTPAPKPTIAATPRPTPLPKPTVVATPRPAPAPVVRLTITPKDVRFNAAGTRTITFTNRNTAQVEVRDVSFNSNTGEFTLEDGCRNRMLSPGQSCQANIAYQPSGKAGAAQLVITYGDNRQQVVASRSSVATPTPGNVTITPSSLNFRVVSQGGSQSNSVNVQNNGTATVIITQIELKTRKLIVLGGNPKFFRTENGCLNRRLLAGSSCRIEITYAPQDSGEHKAQLEIELRGEGTQAKQRLERVELRGEARNVR